MNIKLESWACTPVALMFLAHIDPSLHPSDRLVRSIIAFNVLYHAIATKFIGRSDMDIGAGTAPGMGGVGGRSPRSREASVPKGQGSSAFRVPFSACRFMRNLGFRRLRESVRLEDIAGAGVPPRQGSAFASTVRPGSVFGTCARGVIDDLMLYHQPSAIPKYCRVNDVARALGGAAGTGVPPHVWHVPPHSSDRVLLLRSPFLNRRALIEALLSQKSFPPPNRV